MKKDVGHRITQILDSMETPIPQQRQPIQQDNCPACLPHRQCQCRIYTCIQRRSPFLSPILPSNHPLLSSSSDLPLCSQGRASSVVVVQEHLPGNVGLLYVGTQNPGSSECPWELRGLQRPKSELVHLPTRTFVSFLVALGTTYPCLPVPSRILHSYPSSQRTLHTLYS